MKIILDNIRIIMLLLNIIIICKRVNPWKLVAIMPTGTRLRKNKPMFPYL